MPVVFKAPPLPVLFTVTEAPPMTRICVCCEANFTRMKRVTQNVQASNYARFIHASRVWCERTVIVVVVARAGLFTVRQIREWATCFYLFIYFTLRYVIAHLSSTSAAPSSVLRWRRCPDILSYTRQIFLPGLTAHAHINISSFFSH